jgi:two-component system copper resistance phosphate regulon response regulator CusR
LHQPSARVLIVDDDLDTCALVEDILEEEGYKVVACHSGGDALDLLEHVPFDLVLSDIKMPRITGIDLLRYVRRKELATQVILMTAYASVSTAIQALRGEAFDYLIKPFSLNELRQRVRQAIELRVSKEPRHDVMYCEDLSIDLNAHRVWVDKHEVLLTRLEFDILAHLLARRGCAVSLEELLQEVWGCNDPDERSLATVRSCVRRLRQKIEDDARNPRFILNVWGIGYQLGK